MNETDFIRQQLHLERTHLREILRALRPEIAADTPAHAVALYIDWAGRRLIKQVLAQQTARQGVAALDPALQGQLAAAHLRPEDLLALLEAWSEPLDAAANHELRAAHWRRAAHLSADTILEERRLYAAARGAVAR
ncbi:MAG: hypothetical protein WA825_13715 [Steroidobacteraceae bacterium]